VQGSWPSIPFFWTVELAGACIDTDPAARPNMVDVARAINFVLQVRVIHDTLFKCSEMKPFGSKIVLLSFQNLV
jgi:hypothetical protein